MTYDELRAFFVLLAVAANDTTRHASAQAIYAFSKFPDQKALLVKDIDGRIDTAVEEVLRWSSPPSSPAVMAPPCSRSPRLVRRRPR
jgi:cytochrome P450